MLPISAFTTETERMLGLLRQLVEIESPSLDKAAVDRLGAVVAAQITALGASLEIERQTTAGDHLIARWGTTATRQASRITHRSLRSALVGSGGFLILCHLDTVYPLGTLVRHD